ncbi:heterocyst specific ABC-transporter, membrane fusion protein DevB homolog [Calothrix sp. NIES-4071]|nr:heterocyst specific ABC-transporter, membrane fusion protein DevB homolog [Calothrix sp. NIES-4071]BAZ54950.1 heterocyst specific ABC-transporter, membrane fusion protein DevB homolog [Calothrix sp. NIES-4105]
MANNSILSKVKPRKLIILSITTSLLTVTVLVVSEVIKTQVLQSASEKRAQQIPIPKIKTVTALGRLEPKGKVIKISTSIAPTQESRLEKLLVEEGDTVKVGQVIAILNNRDKLQAAYDKALEAVEVARANLAKVKAGAKVGEIDAQKAEIARIQAQSLGEERAQRETVFRLEAQWFGDKAAQLATIRRLEAELNNAKSEFRRYEQLYFEGAISQSNFDSKRLSKDTLTQQLSEAKANFERTNRTGNKQIQEAKVVLSRIQATSSKQMISAEATLNKIAEVRPVDVAFSEAELKQATVASKEAKANLEQAFVKAPSNGVIFKINTRAGEKVSNDGIVELGQVNQMVVIAEVYQSNISKIRLGQKVHVTSNALNGKLQGEVNFIGWQIQRQNIINSDPSENIDSRVVEVRVNLNQASSKKAAKLTNLQVKTIF